jgi:PAS domain-containing protein
VSGLLAALLDSGGDAVFVLDAGDRVRSANPAGARLVGRECRDLVGDAFHGAVHEQGTNSAIEGNPKLNTELDNHRK